MKTKKEDEGVEIGCVNIPRGDYERRSDGPPNPKTGCRRLRCV